MVMYMNHSDISRNKYMLKGSLAKKGYDWWWHNFTARNLETNEEKAFYVEYYITNPSISPDKVLLGQTSEEAIPSYFMMNVGTWGKNKKQIHQFYPTKAIEYNDKTQVLSVGDCYLSETRIAGTCEATISQANDKAYMTDAGKMEWDLKVNKRIAYNVGYGAGPLLRDLNAFEMFWHAEGIKTEYDGYVILDGIKYSVEPNTSFGYADKNWGSDFTSPWLWISSCHLESLKHNKRLTNSAIELGGGRPKVLGIPINRSILIGIYYEGQMIEFNFSKPHLLSKVSFNFTEENGDAIWNVSASNAHYRIDLRLTCQTKDMLEINYEAPDGKKRHNHLLNGGNGSGTLKIYQKNGTLIDDIAFYHTGCEYGEYDK